jgi:hypothetical protein
MEDRSHLIDNVKEWIHLDNEIKTLRGKMKERRNRKKEITTILVNIMKVNDIDCFDITDGQLIYSKKNLKNPLSKKHLLNALSIFFKDDNQIVKELSKFIMNTRENKIKEDIRRKINIK